MTNNEWEAAIAALLGAQVRHYRKARKMSTQQLSDACTLLGADVPANGISNVETGRRTGFGVAELLVIAKALDVAPVNLLFPLGQQETVRILPDNEVPVWDALAWFTDETPLAQAAPDGSPRAVVDAYRVHADAVVTAGTSQRLLGEHQRKAATTLNPTRRADHQRSAEQFGEMLLQDAQALRSLRAEMRAHDLFPPTLPEPLAWIDEPDDDGDAA